jgi:hypothetical protein
LSANLQEIERLKQVREDLIKQRDWYKGRVENPISLQTGKPLTKRTMRLYRTNLNRFSQLVAMHDRQIKRLST